VLSARNCEDAQRLTQNLLPDLLLLDYHLDAGITGLQLRDRLLCAQQPCIIITADHGEEVRRAVATADCHLLYKPLKPLALKSLMARLLAATLLHVS
jgi:CheY-like chemotaxis protein